MALSRKDIRAYIEDESLTIDEKVARIATANSASMDSLKDQIADLKRENEKFAEIQKELDELKAKTDEEKKAGWQDKYEKEHSDFEAFKQEQQRIAERANKAKAYKAVLKEAGVSEKRFDSILKLTDLDSIETDKNGDFKDVEKLKEGIKSEWSDFLVQKETSGVDVDHPPKNETEDVMTKEQIMAVKDRAKRRKLISEHPEAFQ